MTMVMMMMMIIIIVIVIIINIVIVTSSSSGVRRCWRGGRMTNLPCMCGGCSRVLEAEACRADDGRCTHHADGEGGGQDTQRCVRGAAVSGRTPRRLSAYQIEIGKRLIDKKVRKDQAKEKLKGPWRTKKHLVKGFKADAPHGKECYQAHACQDIRCAPTPLSNAVSSGGGASWDSDGGRTWQLCYGGLGEGGARGARLEV